MASFNLFADQIRRFPPGCGSDIIRYAVKRFERGDFLIQNALSSNPKARVLKIFPSKIELPYSSKELRQIIDLHYRYPDAKRRAELNKEIADLDAQIAVEMAKLTGVDYVRMD